MAKMINISDKFNSNKPVLVINEKEYNVNDSIEVVLKFEELSSNNSTGAMMDAIDLALGENASQEIGVKQMSISNFKVLVTGIMAAMQDSTYEEAAARF